MTVIQGSLFGGTLEAQFWRFHEDNPHIYTLVERFASELLAAGRSKAGIGEIWERIRWELSVATRGDGFKLNNNHRAFYARLWLERHPEHPHFFETRMRKRA